MGHYSSEQVDEFKYLRVNVNTKNNMHNEIQLRINSKNKAYFAMNKVLSSRLLSKCIKVKLYTSYLRPIVINACEIWFTTQRDKKKLLTLRKKFYGKFTDLFETKMRNMGDEKTATWK